jgi:hypothetical protein
MVNLAAIACVKDRNATVLLEVPDDDVRNLLAHAAQLDERLANDTFAAIRDVQQALLNENQREMMLRILTVYMAVKAGAQVGSLDEKHRSASHNGEREAAMERRLRRRLEDADGPVVVIVGSHHLPTFHDHLQGLVDFVALSTVRDTDENPPSAQDRKRSSYLFANDDILKIRATNALEGRSFDALNFMGSLVDLASGRRSPAAQPFGIPGPSRITRS